MTELASDFAAWIGRRETVTDALSIEHAARARATFDLQLTGDPALQQLPPLWQWFYFVPTAQQSALDTDGHPQRGGFLPPIPLPRRMFAGSRMQFHHPLVLGREAVREGVIRSVAMKTGRTGTLAFVTVGYQFTQDGVVCIDEEQDIVYREAGAPVAAPPVREVRAEEGVWSATVHPDSRLLFRFSSLTFNAHRIHYDRLYAREEEGYPGLVVHGPLTAVLLSHLVRRQTDRPIASFSFRGLAPLFDLAPFHLVGRADGDQVVLEALGPDGVAALSAHATLR
jgi:3-methylfumaryl-CoA hydratase